MLVAGVMLVWAHAARPLLLLPGIAIFALFHGYAHGVEAVSYTHLDVYKRQRWARSKKANGPTL